VGNERGEVVEVCLPGSSKKARSSKEARSTSRRGASVKNYPQRVIILNCRQHAVASIKRQM